MRIYGTTTRSTRTIVSVLRTVNFEQQFVADSNTFLGILARVLEVRVALLRSAVDGYHLDPVGFANNHWPLTPAELRAVEEYSKFKTAVYRTYDLDTVNGVFVGEAYHTALTICNLNTGLSATWAVLLG